MAAYDNYQGVEDQHGMDNYDRKLDSDWATDGNETTPDQSIVSNLVDQTVQTTKVNSEPRRQSILPIPIQNKLTDERGMDAIDRKLDAEWSDDGNNTIPYESIQMNPTSQNQSDQDSDPDSGCRKSA